MLSIDSNKLRILITGTVGESVPPPYAGIPKHSLLLAKLWREAGHTVGVTFVYNNKNPDDLGAKGEYFFEYTNKPNKFTKIIFLLKFLLKNPYLFITALIEYVKIHKLFTREAVLYSAYAVFLDNVVRNFKPDVIIAETALIKSFMATVVARRHSIPVVAHIYAEVHDMTMGVNKRLNENDREIYWKTFLKRFDHILSPSVYCACGPERYAGDPKKVSMVYFGIDIDTCLTKKESREDARAYFKIPEGFYAVAVGAFTSRKGHDHLIKAAALLKRENFTLRVLLCGPGDQTLLRNLAVSEGVGDQVYFFTGLSEGELATLYRAANVYCDASNTPRACLGMSLTEGMVVGLPAVAYNAGGIPEVVHDNKNGYLVQTDDIPGLARALRKVAELPIETYTQFGEEAALTAREAVDIKNEARNLLKILFSIVK